MKEIGLVLFFVFSLGGCATYATQEEADIANETRLRFFLGMMEAGGRHGATLGSSIGMSGRRALDSQRVMEQQRLQRIRRYGY